MGWFGRRTEAKEVKYECQFGHGPMATVYSAPVTMTYAEICEQLPRPNSKHPYIDNMRVDSVHCGISENRQYKYATVTWHRGRYIQKPSMEVVWEVC